MRISSKERRALLRELHEHFRVPLPKVAKVANLALCTVENVAAKDGWNNSSSLAALLQQVEIECATHIGLLRNSDADEAKQEKQARALSVLAKTVETLAQIEERLNAGTSSENVSEKYPDNEKTSVDGHHSLQLYQELEKLVAGMEGERKS